MTDHQNLQALIKRRDELKRELSDVEREIQDLSTQFYRAGKMQQAVIDKFSAGKHCIGSYGRHWWVDANGDLVEAVSPDEYDAIKSLVKSGVVEKLEAP